MATTLTDPLIGHLVDGRYEVVSRIARGGMATVYLATDRRLDREVALKIMHPHLAEGTAGADFVARFRREARAAARLTHPGVVAVYDQGVDGETSYLTMEHIDGTNLRRHLAERGSLSVGEAFATVESVLDALAAAHRAGLVHRDIKPENVLLATDGRIKVADFGLARAVTEVTATATGTVLGTVAYLAPELVAHGSSDARTDVYAVGILLYEMLTGSQPFTGATPIQVAYQHVNTDIPAPSDVVGWLPAEVDELVQSLAAREPGERPPHAGAALDLLRRTRAALDDPLLARRADVEPSIQLPAPTGGLVVPAEHPDVDDPDATALLSTGDDGSGAPAREGSTLALRIGSGLEPGPQDARPEPVPSDLRRWRRGVAALLAAVAVVAVGGILAVWYATWGPGAYTTVPTGLVGSDAATVQQALRDAGLGVTSTEAFHPEIPDDHVIGVEPGEGESILEGGTVDLVVSMGPDMRTVPDGLVGQPTDAVVAALTEAGFTVPTPAEEHHDTVPAGHVIAVSQEPGASLPVDSEVTVTSSLGPAPVSVKSVVGLPRDEAVALLEADGLKVDASPTEHTEEWEKYPEGTVLKQSPDPDATALRGDTVTLTISAGAPLVEVPDVFAMGIRAAEKTLTDLGFKVERKNQGAPVLGFVRAQSVPAGTPTPKGTTIVVTVV